MPKVRTKKQPHLVQDIQEKVLLDLQRWGLVLEVLPEEEPVAETTEEETAPSVSSRTRQARNKASDDQETAEKKSAAPGPKTGLHTEIGVSDMAVTVTNLIMGPGTVYKGEFQATEPADSDVTLPLNETNVSGDWVDLGGTNGG